MKKNEKDQLKVEKALKVSVIMSVFSESERQLRRSIDSILEQTFTDFEFIIILDNPLNTKAKKILDEYVEKDKRILFLTNKKNIGLAFSLNKGTEQARGVYIARQDADDRSLPKRLEIQVRYLEDHSNIDVVGTALRYIEEGSDKILFDRYYEKNISHIIKRESPLAHPTVVVKKSIFSNFGKYEDVRYCEDYDLWIRWFLKGVRITNIPSVLYLYYQNTTSVKKTKARQQLFQTILLQFRYRRLLVYTLPDYVFLFGAALLCMLPCKVILKLFYITKKRKKSYKT
ncbi:MAG: glycosyltransferase [Candidatus Pacebacteria bacterium]|nr:glycosyltransferase [Candidatus Paceibacterota bacterium]